MASEQYHLRLSSAQHYGRRVPPAEFGAVLRVVPVAVRKSVRMRLAGSSAPAGRPTEWLDAASDVRFLDHYGDDDTVLVFEAPRLGEVAEKLFRQPDMFRPLPDANDTGFDLLGDVVGEVARSNKESDLFDAPLLREVARLRTGLDGAFQKAALWGNRYRQESPAVIDENLIRTARELCASTPRSQRARICGTLDMIRASTLGFGLKLPDGQEVRGILAQGDADILRSYWKREVVVVGEAVFRPSGHVLRIDAETLVPASESDRFFAVAPTPARRRFDLREVIRSQQHKKGIAAIIGQWPGDESDEEVQEALREVS